MDQKHELLQQTFTAATQSEEKFTKKFFERFFALDTSARALFDRSSLDDVGRKIISFFRNFLGNLDDPQGFAPVIENLAKRHNASYHVRPEQYRTFLEAFVETVREVVDARAATESSTAAFSSEAHEAWMWLTQIVLSSMNGASKSTSDSGRVKTMSMDRAPVRSAAEWERINSDRKFDSSELMAINKHLDALDELLANTIVVKVEKATGIRRSFLVLFLIFLAFLFMFIRRGPGPFCNLVGFMYPAVSTFRSLNGQRDEYVELLSYWLIYGGFIICDIFTEMFLGHRLLIVYFALKFVILVYCFLPQTKGSMRIYNKLINPILLKFQSRIDAAER